METTVHPASRARVVSVTAAFPVSADQLELQVHPDSPAPRVQLVRQDFQDSAEPMELTVATVQLGHRDSQDSAVSPDFQERRVSPVYLGSREPQATAAIPACRLRLPMNI